VLFAWELIERGRVIARDVLDVVVLARFEVVAGAGNGTRGVTRAAPDSTQLGI
jgi:hypothetical protein